jgi:hypothetical protein
MPAHGTEAAEREPAAEPGGKTAVVAATQKWLPLSLLLSLHVVLKEVDGVLPVAGLQGGQLV